MQGEREGDHELISCLLFSQSLREPAKSVKRHTLCWKSWLTTNFYIVFVVLVIITILVIDINEDKVLSLRGLKILYFLIEKLINRFDTICSAGNIAMVFLQEASMSLG